MSGIPGEPGKVGFQLSEEQRLIQQTARDFAQKELKPWVLSHEWLPKHEDRHPKHLVRRTVELGYKKMNCPVEYGGLPLGFFEQCLVAEELATADIGFAIDTFQAQRVAQQIAFFGTKEQKDRFFKEYMSNPTYTASIARTEPGRGSDNNTFVNPDSQHCDTMAKKDPVTNEWVINGQKTFIAESFDADFFLIHACTNPSEKFVNGTSAFMVPRNTPGLTVGRPFEKVARRSVSHASVYLENCRVPNDALLGPLDKISQRRLVGTMTIRAAATLGNARGAYEEALEYARTRVQGGKPIIEHQLIAASLAEMAVLLEAARLLVWKAAWASDRGLPEAEQLSRMAKYLTADYGVKICIKAMEVFGGYGMLLDHPVQKYVREALLPLHGEGTQEMTLLGIARKLQQ